MPLLNAFIARSFLPVDEKRLEPTLTFLETFRNIGFICQSADAAEVQSVSEKVRRLIDGSDVFIGFFTRRYPFYDLQPGLKGAWQYARGIKPQRWSAPAWVLQESGYALQKMGRKRLILLREPDVEVFGLQGDLEYISFLPERSAEVYSKLNEMIHGLLVEAAGMEIKIVVARREEEAQTAIEPAASDTDVEVRKDDTGPSGILEPFDQMTDASEKRDLEKLCSAWKSGIALIEGGKTKGHDRLAWDCHYYRLRFMAGFADGLETLRVFQAGNPTRPEPIISMAYCLNRSKEYEEAAQLFLAAADLSKYGTWFLISAARAFMRAKGYEKGKDAVHRALATAIGDDRLEALSVLYQLLKAGDEAYFAFATAESAIHENPQFNLRFSVALDYHRKDLNDLALYHFKFLHDWDDKDSSSLHNLALLYADCKLPISAVERYKKAFAMGETLSAANLGYMYLDCGMAAEAKALIQDALKVEGHVARVEKCLAEIIERGEAEESKETELLAAAGVNREFLIGM